jgi:hypothetical protein
VDVSFPPSAATRPRTQKIAGAKGCKSRRRLSMAPTPSEKRQRTKLIPIRVTAEELATVSEKADLIDGRHQAA